jgi:hypothetical protein
MSSFRKNSDFRWIPEITSVDTLLCQKSPGKNAPLSVNFVYAWKIYPTSTKLTLYGAPFPSIYGKLFCFCNSVLQMQNEINRKRSLPFVSCKRKTETANLRWLAKNGNGKRIFVFPGRQTINDNRRRLFQETCQSMLIT